MNARERKRLTEAVETYLPLEFREPILRALRLLAVIESAEGETPETDAFVSVRFGQMVCSHAELRDLARRLERERNAALRALEGARDELANVRAQLADHIGHVSTPIK